GVMGAYLLLFPKARIRTLLILGIFIQIVRIPAIIVLGYWMLIQILSGFTEFGSRTVSGIAWFAHIGGFIAGSLLIIVMKGSSRRRQKSKG
ncbi:MAG: rhomboid family intramembrane serine protease, partial [Desulfatiglandales bacterium]